MRKEKASLHYRRQLENHIAYLESTLNNLKNLSENDKRQEVLDAVPFTNFVEPPSAISPTDSSTVWSMLHFVPDVRESVSLFFKWLYPNQYVFIYREAFLMDFLNKKKNGTCYCSEELVYSVAALGASVSDKSGPLYARSNHYYNTAKRIVLRKLFQEELNSNNYSASSSKLILIQSLLCLSFYNIKHGNNELAWYFSGLACRIVHQIGLHLNSNSWSYNKEEQDQRAIENLSQYDSEVRSRVYWGCYLADHLISQLFGRVTTLTLSNSTVPETDDLPDISGIEDFMHNPEKEPVLVKSPVKNLIILSRITAVFVNRIFIKSVTLKKRLDNLSIFNSEMKSWKLALPQELSWTKDTIISQDFYDPTVCCVSYQYYMAILSYNKPFVSESGESRKLIELAIEELYHFLENWKQAFKTFEKCNLYMIYTAILAVQCMDTGSVKIDRYKSFVEFLNSPTLNYALPISLKEPAGKSTIEPLSLAYFFDTYDPDLSLLNEINLLLDIENEK